VPLPYVLAEQIGEGGYVAAPRPYNYRQFHYLLVLNLDIRCTRDQDCSRVRRSCPL
jgi:hypothetical protein